jgi:hypothetical protein
MFVTIANEGKGRIIKVKGSGQFAKLHIEFECGRQSFSKVFNPETMTLSYSDHGTHGSRVDRRAAARPEVGRPEARFYEECRRQLPPMFLSSTPSTGYFATSRGWLLEGEADFTMSSAAKRRFRR